MHFNGDIPSFAPSLKDQAQNGGAVWADAGTIIPNNVYFNYGDKNLYNITYQMMKDYVEALIRKDIEQGNKNLILSGFTFGDWLAQDGVCPQSVMGGTDTGFIMSVYYYYSVNLTCLAAKELGKNEDYEKYNNLKEKIYNAILDEYFTPNGKLAVNTQTGYVLSLYYKIYRNKEYVLKDFKERLKKDFYRMKTGFTGTSLILLCLFDNDMEDDAYRILYNEECPGWIYAINLGATTIWERWNSLLEDGTISGTEMNSFNHYSYGSVCETIYSRIAGLRNLSPGWKKVMIKPQLNYRMKKIDFSYESVSGKYEINWKWVGKRFHLDVNIPNGTEAEIILPNSEKYNVKEGKYHYECDLNKKIYSPFSVDTPLLEILKNEEASKILKEFAPNVYSLATGENDENKLNSIRNNFLPMFNATEEEIKKCEEELSKINP
jgi:alpha-L-rhamnosidase